MDLNNIIMVESDSDFIGYEQLESKSKGIQYAEIGDDYLIVLDKTPFYAESGGQVADKGSIKAEGIDLVVVDVQKNNDMIMHICKGKVESWENIDNVICLADEDYRFPIKRNHTATHLLHAALKTVLGDQVQHPILFGGRLLKQLIKIQAM